MIIAYLSFVGAAALLGAYYITSTFNYGEKREKVFFDGREPLFFLGEFPPVGIYGKVFRTLLGVVE